MWPKSPELAADDAGRSAVAGRDGSAFYVAHNMRTSVTTFLLALVFLSGCRSSSVVDKTWPARQNQIASACSVVIPLPQATPFDADPAARTAFLSAYQDGYRSGLTQLNILFGRPREGFVTYSVARTQGWDAGENAGFAYALRGSVLGGTNSVQESK